jgi:hypothetical protein
MCGVFQIKTLGLRPKPRKGTSPLDPYNLYFHFLASRENENMEIKRGAGELVPLPGFLARAEPKVFIFHIIYRGC